MLLDQMKVQAEKIVSPVQSVHQSLDAFQWHDRNTYKTERIHMGETRIGVGHQRGEFLPRIQFLGEYQADFQQQHHPETRNGGFQYHPSRHDGCQQGGEFFPRRLVHMDYQPRLQNQEENRYAEQYDQNQWRPNQGNRNAEQYGWRYQPSNRGENRSAEHFMGYQRIADHQGNRDAWRTSQGEGGPRIQNFNNMGTRQFQHPDNLDIRRFHQDENPWRQS